MSLIGSIIFFHRIVTHFIIINSKVSYSKIKRFYDIILENNFLTIKLKLIEPLLFQINNFLKFNIEQ